MGKKFVGLDGLKHFWTKAKTWITGQITAEVTAKIAELVANAPEDLDTLKEIADWIKTHANDASAMNTQINTNKNNIAALQTSVAGKAAASHTHDDRYFTETEVTNKLAGKSDTGHTHTKAQITDFPKTVKFADYKTGSLTFSSLTDQKKIELANFGKDVTEDNVLCFMVIYWASIHVIAQADWAKSQGTGSSGLSCALHSLNNGTGYCVIRCVYLV